MAHQVASFASHVTMDRIREGGDSVHLGRGPCAAGAGAGARCTETRLQGWTMWVMARKTVA